MLSHQLHAAASSPVQRILLVACLLSLGLRLGGSQPAHAATLTVTTTTDELNSDGDCSLREAIRAANLDQRVDACPRGSGADTITIPGGEYILSRAGQDEDASRTGDLDIASNLTLIGASTSKTSIDGNALDRVMQIQAGAIVTVSHVIIRNGRVEGAQNGGGIANAGTLQLTSSRVIGNYGSDFVDGVDNGGGGIYNAGILRMNHTHVDDNRSGDEGGGVLNDGTLEVTDSSFDNNVAGFGAGIWNRGDVTILRSTVNGNQAAIDGGVINRGTLSMRNSTISRNQASFLGAGGLANNGTATLTSSTISENVTNGRGGGIANFAQITIINTTISGNTATALPGEFGGGGIYTECGALTMTNSTVSGNHSGLDGGGILADDEPGCLLPGSTLLNNVTITQNIADSDGNGSGDGGGLSNRQSTVRAGNTIIAGNVDRGDEAPDCRGDLTSQGYNLIQDPAGCIITGDPTGNQLGMDPQLGALQKNGGPTFTHALLPGSPAIDAGNPAPPGSGGTACRATDQRRISRPQDGNGDGLARCDIGAYERFRSTSSQAMPPTRSISRARASFPSPT
jgi:CSLREA domain-containing protein